MNGMFKSDASQPIIIVQRLKSPADRTIDFQFRLMYFTIQSVKCSPKLQTGHESMQKILPKGKNFGITSIENSTY